MKGSHWLTVAMLPADYLGPGPQKVYVIDPLGIERNLVIKRFISYLQTGITYGDILLSPFLSEECEIVSTGLACKDIVLIFFIY